MFQKIKKSVSDFMRYAKPRIYTCQDVYLIMWMKNEFIIPRFLKNE